MSLRRITDIEFHEFREDFQKHVNSEQEDRKKLQELYDAVFRQEDETKNESPGLIQMMHRMSDQLQVLTDTNKRLKTFTGGVIFALSLVWVFISELGSKLVAFLHKL